MSERADAHLGYGLYFVDVLACLLFCLTLVLVGARFGRERTVSVELPRAEARETTGSELSGRTISVRERDGQPEIFLDDAPVTLTELEARLRQTPPPSITVRSEASTLARIIALAHAAGVHDIQLAYEALRAGEQPR